MTSPSLEQNLKIYPWYQAATGFLPWMPVFFLFFSTVVSLQEAIELSAIYYISVVIFEIPSGYLSDRFGRRITLIVATLFAIVAYLCFITASSFNTLAIAQVLLAGAIAFQSGSDNSILYDSLVELDQTDTYTAHESRAQQYTMLSLSLSVFLGGLLGLLNLRIPYFAALTVAFLALYLSYSFKEPTRTDHSVTKAFIPQLTATAGLIRKPLLAWVFFFYVIGYALQHVPYEFYQPYIALLSDGGFQQMSGHNNAALVSGIVIGISMFGGAVGAKISVAVVRKFGAKNVLLSSILVQLIIIAGLSIWLHPALLLLVMLRNFSMSMAHAPMHALIAPQVSSGQRATYLSMQSLAGRLGFSMILYTIAIQTGVDSSLDWPVLSGILHYCALLGLIALLALTISARLHPDLFSTQQK